MTRRYQVEMTASARKNVTDIQMDIVERDGPEKADEWEFGFLQALEHLSLYPLSQVQEKETRHMGNPMRRYLYKTSPQAKHGYFLYYALEEASVPDPEPTHDYFAGIVTVFGLSHSTSKGMSKKQIQERAKEL
jgi:plasmid stabilization system protein ParE